jgi:CRISPR system Cascade subunit CasA
MTRLNLFKDQIFTVEVAMDDSAGTKTGGAKARRQMNLGEVLEAMSAGEVASFPMLRPHQTPYLHMFLVQLAAMALDRAGLKLEAKIPAARWENLVKALLPDFPALEPFDLWNPDHTIPAFLQPPVAGDAPETKKPAKPETKKPAKPAEDGNLEDAKGPKGPAIHETPDEIDLVVTTRAHSQKRGFVGATPEHWIYALICRQTAGGYAGKGNYGVMRAPGADHPRFLVSLVPNQNPSERFIRDTKGLLATKAELLAGAPFLDGSHKTPFLWTHPWDGETPLSPSEMGPWTIEIGTRLRLTETCKKTRGTLKNKGVQGSALVCERRLSKNRRISEGTKKENSLLGRLNCPWSPVYVPVGSSASLEGGRPSFEWLARLMFDPAMYRLPILAKRIPSVDGVKPLFLKVEGVHGKDGKTSWIDRTIQVPTRARFAFRPEAAPIVLDMLNDVQKLHKDVLMPAMLAFCDEPDLSDRKAGEMKRQFYPIIRERFSSTVEDSFFAIAAETEDDASLNRWRLAAGAAARTAYDAFLKSMPDREGSSRRKRARGLGALEALLKANFRFAGEKDQRAAEASVETTDPLVEFTPARPFGSRAAGGINHQPETMNMINLNTEDTELAYQATRGAIAAFHQKASIEEAVAKLMGLVRNPKLVPPAQHPQISTYDVGELGPRVPMPVWRMLSQILPNEFHDALTSVERMAWIAVVKAAVISLKLGGQPLSLGQAMYEAGISRLRYDHIMSPLDEEDRRQTLDGTVAIMAQRGQAFLVKDLAFLLLLEGDAREAELNRMDRDYVRAEFGDEKPPIP